MRRERNFIGPAGMGGMVSLWGASSIIKSVQSGYAALNTGSSATLTINSVIMENCMLVYRAFTTDYTGQHEYGQGRWTFTNATTLTVNRPGALGGTETLNRQYITVVEFIPSIIKSIQRGMITTNYTVFGNTASINAVNRARSFVGTLGVNSSVGADDVTQTSIDFNNSDTQLTTSHLPNGNTGDSYLCYQVVEFF